MYLPCNKILSFTNVEIKNKLFKNEELKYVIQQLV